MADQVRWGITGTAGIAESAFIPSLRQTRRGQLVAVASRDLERARAFAGKHDIPRAYGSYEEMLASGEIDALYNPLPNSMHAEWTIRAAAHGLHVFCEKPLAESAAAAEEMVTACDRAGVLLFEAFVLLYHPMSLRLRQVLDDGAIGDLVQMQMSFTFTLQRPTDNIRMNRDLAGGSLMDVGCYTITYARFIFGEEPVSVQAALRLDPEYGVDTRASIVLNFSGDRPASLQSGFDAAGDQHATIHGTRGYIQIPQPCHPAAVDGFTIHTGGKEEEIQVNAGVRPFAPALEHFHDCILDGVAPIATAANAAGTLRVIEAVRESARGGKRIDLP
jgi:D-xylose 1-dehydrogenase (NADP+, D-xylono-1,5-lactone-forming)